MRRLLQHDGLNDPIGYSPDGRYILVSRSESNVRSLLLRLDCVTGETCLLTPGTSEGAAQYLCISWSADRNGLYLLSNCGRQFLALAFLNLATTELRYLTNIAWDIELLAVSNDGCHLALVVNRDGYSQLELYDVTDGWSERRQLTTPSVPRGIIQDITWSASGTRLALTLSAADAPPDIWVWDTEQERAWQGTQSSTGGIPCSTFQAPQLIHYPTFDERRIPAFLYLPRKEPRMLSVIIDIHGGPEAQSRPVFSPITQYLVAHGYAVLAPNVRGSTGYGYEYQSLDDGYRRMDAVADLHYAVSWLRESGIADPNCIAVIGGSYGGFMVLAALTTYPELWAAGVDLAGVANFVTFLENTGPWRRKERESEYGSLEYDRTFLESISPIHAIHRIAAPLFVIHGANDPRVPVDEAEQIIQALRQRDMAAEYLRFEDEGHGLAKRANRLIAYPAIIRFLDTYLAKTPVQSQA